ncbi:MAG TPA: hypothetical protein VFI15_04290 [Candidatus Limnocylindrales bacterium]|nr:hypothetical protein [Candidatus Limnocylindrales bacterium]
MSSVAGRPRRGRSASAIAVVAAGLIITLAGCNMTTRIPSSTQAVAGETDVGATPVAARTGAPAGTGLPGPDATTPPDGPSATPETPRVTSIEPGIVDRSSVQVTATYRVNAAITVRSGALDVSTAITVRNDSGAGIDRLELNTIAARLGGISILGTTVDDAPVQAAVDDQTISVPLGGVLPTGATTVVRVEYRAALRKGTTGSDWMFSRSGGVLALYRWIPWVSVATPFDRPNSGQPFVTASSPEVGVEILTDEPMVLAAPSADLDEYAAGSGKAWSFTVTNVRDVALVLAPEFRVAHGKADGVPVRAFARPGGPSATQLLDFAVAAVRAEADQLGMAFPAASMTVVDTPAGVGLESPGMVWVPRRLDTRNRTYAIYQGVAHQWFYGLVGSDQRTEPFADEAPSDLLARTVLGTLRASRCGQVALDRPITKYASSCYYEQVFVQGGRVLDDLRRRMGTDRFWAALRAYIDEYRDDIGGTRRLLEALRAGTKVDLLPVLRSRFPTLY